LQLFRHRWIRRQYECQSHGAEVGETTSPLKIDRALLSRVSTSDRTAKRLRCVIYPNRQLRNRQLRTLKAWTFAALLPELLIVLQPVGNLMQWGGFETAWPPLSIAPPGNQPSVLQHSEVLTDGRHAHIEWFRQLRSRTLRLRSIAEDRPPCWIGKCRKGRAQVVRHSGRVSGWGRVPKHRLTLTGCNLSAARSKAFRSR